MDQSPINPARGVTCGRAELAAARGTEGPPNTAVETPPVNNRRRINFMPQALATWQFYTAVCVAD